jgi:signal transduction histidine kinase
LTHYGYQHCGELRLETLIASPIRSEVVTQFVRSIRHFVRIFRPCAPAIARKIGKRERVFQRPLVRAKRTRFEMAQPCDNETAPPTPRPAANASWLPAPARAELEEELTEVAQHRAAISEVLRVIASSPRDLQPIFDTIIDSATRLCRADLGGFRLYEREGFRLVSLKAQPHMLDEWSPPIMVKHKGFLPQLAAGKFAVHVPDLAAHELYRQAVDSHILGTVDQLGIRTILVVPLVKDEAVIGTLTVGRKGVQPFTDKQIALLVDFGAQAAIALEITRNERRYREVQLELAHVNRVATMGQLTASIAGELKQPLTAAVMNGEAGLRWLARNPPENEKAKCSIEQTIKDVNRAAELIDRIRGRVKKKGPQIESLDINDAILEVIGLTRSEVTKNDVAIRMQLADCLPPVQGDRVQLLQVMLNLVINAIQAMSDLGDGKRELNVSTDFIESEGVRVCVQDTGPGLSAENLEQLFHPFYTTKPNGMGLGLSICRSIIEDHGGRLWATRHEPHGALFQFTIPVT